MQKFKAGRLITCFLSLYLAFCIAGCSGKTGTDSDQNGDLSIGITDAPGDFTTYTVKIDSISLVKANGAKVETLPETAEIDFAQYTELSEFLTSVSVPLGAYTSATLTLDYTDADIQVEDEDGNSTSIDKFTDSDGNVVSTLQVSVALDNKNKLVIAPGVPSHLLLDFNLKASNYVEFSDDGTTTLVIDPSLIAEVDYQSDKPYKIRGFLKDVDTDESCFQIGVRPFYKVLKRSGRLFGNNKISTDSDTVFEIDGLTYQGAEGLTVLAAMPATTPLEIEGLLSFTPRKFLATSVYAGSSVPGVNLDFIRGSVVSRSLNTIIVKGIVGLRDSGRLGFKQAVTITMGEDQIVKKINSTESLGISSVSPGQRILVYGSIDLTENEEASMDISEGLITILPTTLKGVVAENDYTLPLAVNLSSINSRDIDVFDFTGTGIDESSDADPSFYEIGTGLIDISDYYAQDPVKIIGFVAPFGSAPDDFEAQTLVNLKDVSAFIKINWKPSTEEPFTKTAEGNLQLNHAESHTFHHLGNVYSLTDIESLENPPVLSGASEDSGTFIIKMKGTKTLFNDFSEFVEAVDVVAGEGNNFSSLFASGTYDSTSNIFNTDYLMITVK